MGVDLSPLLDTSTIEDITAYEETENPDSKAHVVNPPKNLHIWQPGMTSQDIVNIARLQGKTVTALCGYKFIPRHDPDKHPACEVCIRIAGELIELTEKGD